LPSRRPMRILLATSNRSVVGGVETYLQSLIPSLIKRGHEVAVLYLHRAFNDTAEVVDLGDTGIPVWYWPDFLNDPAIRTAVAHWKPDLVYSHCPDSLQMEQALLADYPCIVCVHNYWGTCTTGRKCHDFPHPHACERKFGLACLALHYPRRCGGLNPLTAFKMFQTHRQRNLRLNEYRRIIVSSMHMHREYERHGIGSDKLRLVPYPLTDPSLERTPFARKQLGGSLLFVGRLTALKGVDYLIRAVPKAAHLLGRDLTLTVMGDGPERSRLETLAQQLSVQVRFPGWLTGKEKIAAMSEANLLVVPSRWPEPFGLVGIEAGCLSVPAVGYALGGIPDWLIGGVNGELASGDPPTVAGLVDAIVAALNHPDQYARLTRGAWEISHQFTIDRHLGQLEAIMHQALGETIPHTKAVSAFSGAAGA